MPDYSPSPLISLLRFAARALERVAMSRRRSMPVAFYYCALASAGDAPRHITAFWYGLRH